jgi:hypothetical protein
LLVQRKVTKGKHDDLRPWFYAVKICEGVHPPDSPDWDAERASGK